MEPRDPKSIWYPGKTLWILLPEPMQLLKPPVWTSLENRLANRFVTLLEAVSATKYPSLHISFTSMLEVVEKVMMPGKISMANA